MKHFCVLCLTKWSRKGEKRSKIKRCNNYLTMCDEIFFTTKIYQGLTTNMKDQHDRELNIVKGYKENQRLVFSDKGMISLLNPEYFTMNMYEIYSLYGNLFEDIERFDTEIEALNRCRELFYEQQ